MDGSQLEICATLISIISNSQYFQGSFHSKLYKEILVKFNGFKQLPVIEQPN